MPITFDNVTINNGITINYAPIIVTGGNLTFDGSYSIRTFTANGTLGISGGSLSVDYLLTGGGGQGLQGQCDVFGITGGVQGGGGGGVVVGTITLSTGSQTVTIGSGQQLGVPGTSTTLGSLLSASPGSNNTSGGNSGAGGSGGTFGGIGGDGYLSSISGTSTNYGGGGGGSGGLSGGTGGAGGGGDGGNYQTTGAGTNGTPNTGGGGGASATTTAARGRGGSGILIIRYLTAGTA